MSTPYNLWTHSRFLLTELSSSMSSIMRLPLWMTSQNAANSSTSDLEYPYSSTISIPSTGLHLFPPLSSKSQMGWLKALVRLDRWFFPWLNLWLEVILVRLLSLNYLGIRLYITPDFSNSFPYCFRTSKMSLDFGYKLLKGWYILLRGLRCRKRARIKSIELII